MKVIWALVIHDKQRRWMFDTYSAVSATMKKNYNADLPPENMVTNSTRIGREVPNVGWVSVDAVPIYSEPINL